MPHGLAVQVNEQCEAILDRDLVLAADRRYQTLPPPLEPDRLRFRPKLLEA